MDNDQIEGYGGPGMDCDVVPDYDQYTEVPPFEDRPSKTFTIRFDAKEPVAIIDKLSGRKVGIKGYGRASIKVYHPVDYVEVEDPEKEVEKKASEAFIRAIGSFSEEVNAAKLPSMKKEVGERIKAELEKEEYFPFEINIMLLMVVPVSQSAVVPSKKIEKKPFKCRSCGAWVQYGTKFCDNCGTKLDLSFLDGYR